MKAVRLAACVVALLMPLALPARKHDPLNQLEIDQLRDAAQDPLARLKLYVQFARERLLAVEKLRADPKVTNRGEQTHDGLEDFMTVYDELNGNIDTFDDRHEDLRKPLKLIIDADAEFQAKLRALKASGDTSPEEAKRYEFVLSNALETLDSSVRDHRDLLAEQEEAAKHKKKK